MSDYALLSDDRDVEDAVLSAAAAAGVAIDDDVARARCVLASPGRAVDARAGCGPGAQLWVVGSDPAVVGEAAMAAGARVLLLPAGSRLLAELFVGHARARLLGVVGGSGGVGASTLAVALAQAVADRGETAALVECDPLGGGIDLLLGAERAAGWRWSSLAGARGELGDLRAHLPVADGVTLVCQDRAERVRPGPAALRAVLESLARSHDVVVCDVGPPGERADAVRALARCVVVVAGRVTSVAAAQGVLAPGDTVAVRSDPGASLSADDVGTALGARVCAVLPQDRRVAEGAEQGVAPWQAGGRAWRRGVAAVLAEVDDERR